MNEGTGKIQSFRDLKAWQEGHTLVLSIYRMTEHFPKEEKYSLTDQMRRASVSVTSNIAEGFSRQSKKEKMRFYVIALGSLTEIQNQLLIARDLGFITQVEFFPAANTSVTVHKLINGLIKYCKQ